MRRAEDTFLREAPIGGRSHPVRCVPPGLGAGECGDSGAEIVANTLLRNVVAALHHGKKVELRSFGSFRPTE